MVACTGTRIESAAFLVQYEALLLYTYVWVQFGHARAPARADLNLFYAVVIGSVCLVALRVYLVLLRRASESWAYVWLSLDLTVLSCAVYLTGGIQSDVVFLYFWPIATSAIERHPRRTVAVGLLSAVLYTGATWPEFFTGTYLATLNVRILMFLLTTLMGAYYAVTETKRVEEIASLREKATLADYRTRLSREMHDGIQHYLVGISARLELARSLVKTDPERAASMAIDQRLAVRQASDELRHLVRMLRSPALEREGFVDALTRHLSLFAERSSISVPLDIQGAVVPLPPDVAHAALRTVQEALTNAEKHAHAQQVTVTVRFGPELFECVIADNGAGFRPAEAAERPETEVGFGLSSMKQRAQSVGGELHVKSAPGQGTEITFSAPLESQEPASAQAVAGHALQPARP